MKNKETIKNMIFGNNKKLSDLCRNYLKINNTNSIKRLLLTNQGIELLKNLNSTENQRLWNLTIQHNDIKLLRGLNKTGIKMNLLTLELVDIIKSFNSVDYYQTFEFLFDYIRLDNLIAYELIHTVIYDLKTPNTIEQQNSQFAIYNKLTKLGSVKVNVSHNFDDVIESLNIPLVAFYINVFNIDINELFTGSSVLQWVVNYLINHPNKNNNFAYKMFQYLLTIGADINKRNWRNLDINNNINKITDSAIKMKLNEIIQNHQVIIKLNIIK